MKFPSRPASCPGIAASAPNMAVCLFQTKSSMSLMFCRLSLVSSGLGHCRYGLGNLRMSTHLGTSHGKTDATRVNLICKAAFAQTQHERARLQKP